MCIIIDQRGGKCSAEGHAAARGRIEAKDEAEKLPDSSNSGEFGGKKHEAEARNGGTTRRLAKSVERSEKAADLRGGKWRECDV